MVQPETTFYPDMLEGYLLLSLDLDLGSGSDAVNDTNSSTSDNNNSGALGLSSGFESTSAAGVLWNISAFSPVFNEEEPRMGEGGMMDWTAFPATGLLLPGKRWASREAVMSVGICFDVFCARHRPGRDGLLGGRGRCLILG